MGNYLSQTEHNSDLGGGGEERKRKRIHEFDLTEYVNTRKRCKLRSTCDHIYGRLFLEGHNSDVVIRALDREWRLHKVYLEQSPYFQSMFSGSWIESSLETVELNIIDPLISSETLNTALSSLYRGEIDLEVDMLVPLLATVTLLQFHGLQLQIEALMIETMNEDTVLPYINAASTYGSFSVVETATDWLKVNLLHSLPQNLTTLSSLPMELLIKLISANDLFVNQTEFSVYILLRLWLYLQITPKWNGDPTQAVTSSHIHFRMLYAKESKFFLNLETGSSYAPLFRALRLPYLVNHHLDLEMLLSDGIVPMEWVYPMIVSQWEKLLRVDQGLDTGPNVIVEEEFNQYSMRCGRNLTQPNISALWRWTGFNMGLDLIVHYEDGVISLKRNFKSDELLLSTHKSRSILCRVTASRLNEQKQVIYRISSGIKKIELERLDESHELLRIEQGESGLKFPLCLAFNFCVNNK
ncbi:germ cell-less protein-like 1 [Lepeophtheirus salmonis]|uniref:germ cell-less protein-like 1 n=1 Tax=Lepeophtheirus salmonis TaxID=72036 RepID=UPI00077F4979|nr:germ cell-less protein-like 1 [Lepeophtheirus salmonis]